MLTLPGCHRDVLLLRTKHLAHAWSVVRTDGQTFRFTSFDRPLVLDDGYVYTPTGSFNSSARRRENRLRDHEQEYDGHIKVGAIIADDLKSGRFKEAIVTEKVIDYRVPFLGPLYTFRYWVDDVTFSEEVWTFQCSTITRFLRNPIGGVITRNCQKILGDSECTKDVSGASFTASAVAVTGMEDGDRKRIIIASGLSGTFVDDWFNGGYVQFTSGSNSGFKMDIKDYTQSLRRIELQLPMPFVVSAADQFTIVVGCNKLRLTCKDKFSNLVNYGGRPYMPGTDRILQTPRR